MSAANRYAGRCFCGELQFTVTGEPVVMGYCHCETCRSWTAAPVSAFTLWKPEAVQITRGEEHLGTSNRTTNSDRKWCTRCGGHVFTDHPGMALTEICAAVIPELKFSAGVHVHYQESVLRIKDGLPKLKDVPIEAGGSGITLPE